MIKSFLRRSATPLLGRLDRLQAGIDQVNRDGMKNSDPARDLVMLSLRDSVSLLGVTTARLSTRLDERPEPDVAFLQSVAIAALGGIASGERVAVLGDTLADRVAEVAEELGIEVLRGPIAAASSFSFDGLAALLVLADRSPEPEPAARTRSLPPCVVVGARLREADSARGTVHALARAVGADDDAAARVGDLVRERECRGVGIATAVHSG